MEEDKGNVFETEVVKKDKVFHLGATILASKRIWKENEQKMTLRVRRRSKEWEQHVKDSRKERYFSELKGT